VALIVQKYGGTSMGSPERIRNVAQRVAKYKAQGHQVVVVVSAMSGETNRLIALAKEIQKQPDPRELDVVISTGEQVTIGLLSMALKEAGLKAKSYTGAQVKILTDSAFTKARIVSIDEQNIRADLANDCVVVVQASRAWTKTATSPRWGAAARTPRRWRSRRRSAPTNARSTPTWTASTPPTRASCPRRGACTPYRSRKCSRWPAPAPRCCRSVRWNSPKYKVSCACSPACSEGEGTLITFEEGNKMEQAIISGIAFNRDEAKITVLGVPDKPGIAYQILGPVSDANIDVDMIIQNVGVDGTTDFSFTVNRNEFAKAMDILKNKVQPHIGAREVIGDNKAARSRWSAWMRSHVGIASKMFRTLAEEGINIQMISTSEIKISVVIDEKYLELAVRVLHKAFNLDQEDA
jgi:aspartate kinase